tara:strand:+ start:2662 stop:2847 length:186 start_codon:yes stop_codon:yes gene_type:complete
MSSIHLDEFKEKISIVIDSGNISMLQEIIKSYKNIIDNKYIILAQEMLDNLLEETIQEMNI